MCKCTNLEGLLKAESEGLNVAFGHRRYLISKKDGKLPEEIPWDEAKNDFMEHYFNAWAEGFKAAYCHYACDKRDECEVKDSEFNFYKRYIE